MTAANEFLKAADFPTGFSHGGRTGLVLELAHHGPLPILVFTDRKARQYRKLEALIQRAHATAAKEFAARVELVSEGCIAPMPVADGEGMGLAYGDVDGCFRNGVKHCSRGHCVACMPEWANRCSQPSAAGVERCELTGCKASKALASETTLNRRAGGRNVRKGSHADTCPWRQSAALMQCT